MPTAQELAILTTGLSPAEESLVWCKYLGEKSHCQKGLDAYRGHLVTNKKLNRWLLASEIDARKKKTQAIAARHNASVVLSACAYNDMISLLVCGTCRGAGEFLAGDLRITCTECEGKGKVGSQSSAQDRANKLHTSLSTYWRTWHKEFEEYYWTAVTDIELGAASKVAQNFRRLS